MRKNTDTIAEIRHLDDLSQLESPIHRIHPVSKMLATFVFLVAVVSFGKNEIEVLLPFFFYPVVLFTLSELPVKPVLKRLLWISPFLIGVGILNPFFERQTVMIGEFALSAGWLTFFSILVKSSLTVTVSILLIATTGMDALGYALRVLRVPKIFVLQLMLTYRYITVLLEEVSRMTTAYSLRAPGQKGVAFHAWGSFAGQLLLRTFDRAQRIYRAMSLRGFDGNFTPPHRNVPHAKDVAYAAGWSAFFVIARIFNIPMAIGMLINGGF